MKQRKKIADAMRNDLAAEQTFGAIKLMMWFTMCVAVVAAVSPF